MKTFRDILAVLFLFLTIYVAAKDTFLKPLEREMHFLDFVVTPLSELISYNQNWGMFTRGSITPLKDKERNPSHAGFRVRLAFIEDDEGRLWDPFLSEPVDLIDAFYRTPEVHPMIRSVYVKVGSQGDVWDPSPLLQLSTELVNSFEGEDVQIASVVFIEYDYGLPLNGERPMHEEYADASINYQEWGRVAVVGRKPVSLAIHHNQCL